MNIMIIGGTSGIGLATAKHYLESGHLVGVAGRDITRIGSDLREQFPLLSCYQFDIRDAARVTKAISEFADGALDMLIVSAGFYADADTLQANSDAASEMIRTNIGGLYNAFDAASSLMLKRQRGQLVAIASIAGLLKEYPQSSLYSVTKRAVIGMCAAYRKMLAPFSIAVTVIVPGYLDTAKLRALNNGDASRKPFLLTEQQAVAHIVEAIAQRKPAHSFPWQLRWLVACFNYLPVSLKSVRKK